VLKGLRPLAFGSLGENRTPSVERFWVCALVDHTALTGAVCTHVEQRKTLLARLSSVMFLLYPRVKNYQYMRYADGFYD